jgi:multidrug efflux system membrane fusion protein
MDEQVEPLVRADPTDRTTVRQRRPRVRIGRLILALLLLTAAGGGAWYWWTHKAPQSSGPAVIQGGSGRGGATSPPPVGIATAERGDVRVILNALGTVTPLATVIVKTQLNV